MRGKWLLDDIPRGARKDVQILSGDYSLVMHTYSLVSTPRTTNNGQEFSGRILALIH
jgi:hypothetical protein